MDAILERFVTAVPREWCESVRRDLGFNEGGGLLSSPLTCWLMVRQRLEGLCVAEAWLSVSPATALLFSPGSKRAQSGKLSAFGGGYGHARQALPLRMAEEVADRLYSELTSSVSAPEFAAVVLDGTSLSPDGSASLREAYPPCSNQHGKSHFPVIRMAVAHDLWTGLALRPAYGPMYGPQAVSEQSLATELSNRLPTPSLVLADRNFGVFSVAYDLSLNGHSCLFRLTDQRAKSMLGKAADLSVDQDCAITWTPSRFDRKTRPDLPEDALLKGRVVIRHVIAPSGRAVRLCLLLIGTQIGADEAASLYAKRWLIETDLRTLKSTLHLDRLSSRSPDVLAKEIVLAVAAYNLVRAMSACAAELVGVPARTISFKRMAACMGAYTSRLVAEPDPIKRQALCDEMNRRAAAVTNKPRNRPAPPRKAWERRSKFPKRSTRIQEAPKN